MKNLTKTTLVSVMILLFFLVGNNIYGQRNAYVDTQYILDNIPEYKDAQDELDAMSKKWQKEIESKFSEVETMYKKYQSEAVLLPDDVKKKREEEIVNKEKEVKELQKKYFGPEGELYKKRQELVEPIQEKVYNAIETIATTKNYSFVFDKSGGVTLLYGDPKFDISDDVLDEVGQVMQTVKRDQRKREN